MSSSDRLTGETVIEIVADVASELRDGRSVQVELDTSFERLGLDSLARAELLSRLEDELGRPLPDRLLAEAESPRDLLRAGERALDREERTEEDEEEPESATEPLEEPAVGEASRPEEAATLLEVLDWHADRHPDRRHVLFLDDEGAERERRELSYGELASRAQRVASALLERGVGAGDAVGIMLPSGLEYFAIFLGVEMAGAVPVPVYPPTRRSQLEDHLQRQSRILSTARTRLLVAFSDVKPLMRLISGEVPELEGIVTAEDLVESGDEAGRPTIEAEDTAFLQFTSGSTGQPKGVILTHANLLANLRAVGGVVDIGREDVVVSWLPLYHDMGLIGAWMGSLYFGVPLVLMSPLAFLRRPARWLQAISRHEATISASPNFGYALATRKVDDEVLEDLDLSGWRVALNGAEPVSPETVESFCERFEPCGFSRQAMMPVYGLAENSVAVAFTPPGRGPRIESIDRETLQRERRAVPVEEEEGGEDRGDVVRFVSCGHPIPDHEVRIVGDDGREVAERHEGRLQFRGPSSTSGYYRNPDATSDLFSGGEKSEDAWLESDDLGYVAGGEVFLTGRTKDVIIRAGRNVYPQELEEAVGDLEGVRAGCVAVFAVEDSEDGTEGLVVMAETRLVDEEARSDLEDRISSLAVDLTGTSADDVALVPPRTVPKTSSGKIRRSAARETYLEGGTPTPRAVWVQVVRLALGSLPQRLRRWRRAAGGWLYSAAFWVVVGFAAPIVWPLVSLTPGRHRRRRLGRRICRVLARTVRIDLTVEGAERLDDAGARVVVSNHASYLDGFTLTAALPPHQSYAVKGELTENPFTRTVLGRLGAVFVERFRPEAGEAGVESLRERLEEGEQVVVFPEGTFGRAPGVREFRMGAFVAAARAGVPLVPVAIRGTRSILRGSSAFVRRGSVRVIVGEPMEPEGDDWESALELRQRARSWIVEHCGEPAFD